MYYYLLPNVDVINEGVAVDQIFIESFQNK